MIVGFSVTLAAASVASLLWVAWCHNEERKDAERLRHLVLRLLVCQQMYWVNGSQESERDEIEMVAALRLRRMPDVEDAFGTVSRACLVYRGVRYTASVSRSSCSCSYQKDNAHA